MVREVELADLKVRELAAESLGVDLSDIDSKRLVREVVDAFLLSTCNDDDRARLSNKRECGNQRFSIGESSYHWRVLMEGWKSRSWFQRYQLDWRAMALTFRKSFLAIEEAIRKVKSNIRSELERKQIESEDKSDPRPSNPDIRNGPEFKKPKFFPAAAGAHAQAEKTTAAAAPKQKLDIYPIEIDRFDGKNYHDWARRVKLFLKQLNLPYVLADPCPSAVGANTREIPQILAAAQKWMDNDYLCRTNILSSLSDHLFDSFSKKPGSAKELWDELKLLYLAEEYGSKTSLINKYMEFQMTEEKSAVDQAQELNELADSLAPYGFHVEESFHVNAIISKQPSSWNNFGVKLMMENNLPVWMMMNCLKQEEELQKRGKRGASPTITAHNAELPRGRCGWQPAYSNRPGVVPPKFAPERERKVLFFTICKRKGHLEEKCWFKNSKDERV